MWEAIDARKEAVYVFLGQERNEMKEEQVVVVVEGGG